MSEQLTQSISGTGHPIGSPRRGKQRGAAMLVALTLTLCLTMLIVAIQLQITTELKSSRGQRDYDRALQLAEAGANAYLNYLATGGTANTAIMPWGAAAPPVISTGVPSTAQVRSAILAGNVRLGSGTNVIGGTTYNGTMGLVSYPAQAALTAKPAAGSQYGYLVVLTGTPSATVTLVSYGYANGIVRRIQASGSSSDIFDWAAVYGMDPYSSGNSGPGLAANQNPTGTDSGPAWDFLGSASIVGASGAEGLINGGNNVSYYDGPVILSKNGNTLNATNPTVSQSAPNVPSGHSGTGTLSSPTVRRLSRSLNIETADVAANRWAAAQFGQITTAGVEFFQNSDYNNNATGVRMLVKNTATGKVRELASAWPIPTTGQSAYAFTWPQNSDLTAAGMVSGETFAGLRVYPGNYYIQKWTQQSSDVVYLRTTSDSSYIGVDENNNSMPVYSDAAYTTVSSPNPNSNMSTEKNIRFFIGNPTSGNSPNSSFSDATFMEDTSFASRFRIYAATRGTVTVSGTNSNPPRKFRVNLLASNTTAGTGANAGKTVQYGDVSIASGTYLFGSLLAWHVKVAGGVTIEKQATEGIGGGGNGQSNSVDRLVYVITAWTELP